MKSWGFLMGGNLLYALALALFLTGNNIAAGGLAGIAVVLCGFLPLGVGMLTLAMNIPILVSAVVIKGWRYTAGTIAAAFLYSFTVEILDRIMPTLTREPLVAAVFGGVLYGIGMTLLTVGNVSVGGTDLRFFKCCQAEPVYRRGDCGSGDAGFWKRGSGALCHCDYFRLFHGG